MRSSANVSESDTRSAHEEARIAQNKETERGGSASVIQRSLSLRLSRAKCLRCAHNDTSTNPIITGTSISGPITAANAAPLSIPKVATATAIASSKLFDAAVNDSVAHCG